MMTVKAPLDLIQAPHAADCERVRLIAADMRICGWRGAPLLVSEEDGGQWYQAWTGSHRLAAAALARLVEVPVIIIQSDERPLSPRSSDVVDWARREDAEAYAIARREDDLERPDCDCK